MPRITLDPNDARRPDYRAGIYDNARNPFVNENTTHDQAAEILETVWTANNVVERQLWQEQVQADLLETEERRREADEARLLIQEETDREKADQRKDELTRNKSKYAPIPALPVPSQPPVIASHYASRRMDKGEYVPLWYYTNRGLEDAFRSYDTGDDEAMTLVQNSDGATTLLPTTATKDPKGLIDDQDLDWEDFCVSSSRMILAMGRAGWPQPRIRMMTNFWSNLQTHDYRSSHDPLEQKALLIYQAEQRRQWHFAITTPDSGYSLSDINEEVLRKTKECLFWKQRNRRDKLREQTVSALPPPPYLTAYSFPPPPAPFPHPLSSRAVSCHTLPIATCMPFPHTRTPCSTHAVPTHPTPCSMHAVPARPTPCFMHAVLGSTHELSLTNGQALANRFHVAGDSLTLAPTRIAAHPSHQEGAVLLPQAPLVGVLVAPTTTSINARVFRPAQAGRSTLPVQSAWAVTHTTFANATPLRHGTDTTPPWPNASRANCYSEPATPHCVSTGNSLEAAAATATTAGTSAPAATKHLTELRNALEQRKHKALTPYKPDAWEHLLLQANLLGSHHHIPSGLRHGFRIDLPLISHTQAPPNRSSIGAHSTEFNKIVAHEFHTGRYLGPLSQHSVESLIGPFQSSPLSIIPKPGKPGKFRLIQNYSFPHKTSTLFPNPSVNSTINSCDFPTTWGTFTTISLLLRRLPPGSQIATRDVAEAYRTVPLHHSQWPAAVVRIGDNSFAIDTSTCFGVSPSAGIYGDVRNAGADILRFRGIGPLSAWVDDHFFIRILRQYLHEYNERRRQWHLDILSRGKQQIGGRTWYGGRVFEDGTVEEFDEDCGFRCRDLSLSSPRSPEDSLYTYNFDDIDRASEELGIPWERSKDQAFGTSATYIGFDWDLPSCTVSLGAAKKAKYLDAIREWQTRSRHALSDVERLYGKLIHTCMVIPSGRAYLTSLETMLGTCHDRPFALRTAVKGVRADLEWWVSVLERPLLGRPIPGPVRLTDVGAFSDASSGVGIGIVIGQRWRAWRLIPGWQTLDGKRDIAWAESIGFECLIRALVPTANPFRHYRVYGDNKGVVEGWWNGRSRSSVVNEVFKRVHTHLADAGLELNFHSTYVPTATNPADKPSRGVYPPSHRLLPPVPLPACLDNFLIDSREPYNTSEQRAYREGRYPRAVAKRIHAANERDERGIQHSLQRLESELPLWIPGRTPYPLPF